MKKLFATTILIIAGLFIFTGNAAVARSRQIILQKTSNFRLDVKIDDKIVPTGRWWSISGGEPISVQKRPGQSYYTDITVKGPFIKDRKIVMDWINNRAAKGKRERVDMILTFMNDAGDDLNTYTLYQSLPISYQPPAVSAGNYDMLEESLTFRVEKIKKRDNEAASHDQNPSDEVLFGGKFRIDIDGDVPATSFSGGGVTFDKREVTGGERRGVAREYSVTKVNWANIVIEKNAVQGDTKWKDWFEKYSKDKSDCKNVILEYKDSEEKTARSIDFKNSCPVKYNVINIDSRSESASVKEVIELLIGYAIYK